MTKIEAVIFDWGGVLIDDPEPGLIKYCAEVFGIPTEQYIEAHNKYHEDFQKGTITEDKFWQRVCKELGKAPPKEHSLWSKAFRSVYIPRDEVFAIVRELKSKRYRVGVLTNTEEPARVYWLQLGYDMFDEAIFSCQEGLMKPQKHIYELAAMKLGIAPTRTVMIDDKRVYVLGAKMAGLMGIIYENPQQTRKSLKELGVNITST
jgi:epoxide hydrolase-like predicted phosphatase